jgi:hypothetical protein
MRVFSATVFLATLTMYASGQAGDGPPMSMLLGWGLDKVPVVHAASFDAQAVLEDDLRREEMGLLPLYGRMRPVGATLAGNGHWTTMANGDRVWRLKVTSEGALATDLFFDDFHLPPGSMFHVYDPAGEQIHGPFTDRDVQAHGLFTTDMIFGESSIIEYFEPHAVRGEGHFTVTGVSHAYRMVGAMDSDPCQVDVNCAEGNLWEEQRDAVVRIRVVNNVGTGWCSGVLVNNTDLDCAPYILSALHCADGSTTAHFNQFVFRFRYHRNGCLTGTVNQGANITGAVKRADSNDGGGSGGSDFMLMELNQAIPATQTPYYAGWSVAGGAPTSGRTIHHPAGDIKKISTFNSTAQTAGWGINGSHWRVVWITTANGHGVTEGGSSGAPLFDQNKRVVGTLTGGSSCCTVNGCGSFTGPNAPDFYGKMTWHWTNNPNTATQKLQAWLNPAGGVTIFDGSYNPCGVQSVEERGAGAVPGIYPNPGRDRFTVEYPYGVVRADRLEVMDLSGRLVHAESPQSAGRAVLDASRWSSGTYLVNVIAGGVRYAGAKLTVEGR